MKNDTRKNVIKTVKIIKKILKHCFTRVVFFLDIYMLIFAYIELFLTELVLIWPFARRELHPILNHKQA